MDSSQPQKLLPVLALEDALVLPHVAVPLTIGRAVSRAAVEAAAATPDRQILVVSRNAAVGDETGLHDRFEIGTRGVVREVTEQGGGLLDVVVQGIERVRVGPGEQFGAWLRAGWVPSPVPITPDAELEALRREVHARAFKLVSLAKIEGGAEILQLLRHDQDIMRSAYRQAALFGMDLERGRSVLEANTAVEALRLLLEHIDAELAVAVIRNEISERTSTQLAKEQRDMVLRQQIRTIQEELSGGEPDDTAHPDLVARLAESDLPESARREAARELSRLARTPQSSPEHGLIRTYVEFLLDLPWTARPAGTLDLARSRGVMDEDHLHLEEVKDRIIEHLATLKLNPTAKAPILCFVGPPGVGKTSLGKSIARALDRSFERLSLGGLHDEAELRGHRRTYIGAMPGRILQAIRRVRVKDPVIMLDEIDKLGHDFRGDPAAAMLELLDPEQNCTFRDNYLDLPFDLSRVFFITTANSVASIPSPLLDRMEVLYLSGYSEEQKLAIAGKYLVPRQLAQSGLPPGACTIPGATLADLTRNYTREAGLRQLERAIGRLVRKVAVRFAAGSREPVTILPEELADLLGPEPFFTAQARTSLPAGVATGLAWTEAGGDVLYVECTLLPGEKGMILTGQLGEVMQESARAAQSYLQSHARELGLPATLFRRNGVHIHVPAGAIPKDGPSAGITMMAALASLYAGKPARPDTAMTGEITLSGLVLPVGGLKEKVLAARRAAFTRVVLPRRNEANLSELPPEVRSAMEFVLVERVEDALAAAIPGLKVPVACGSVARPPRVRGPGRTCHVAGQLARDVG